MALYGLRRSGLDWGTKVRVEVMAELNYRWVRDVGETSMYIRQLVLVIVATDDFACAGPPDHVNLAYDELDRLLGFLQKSKDAPQE